MAKSDKPPKKGGRLVFCRSYVHPKTRRRIYAKSGRTFRFWVQD